MADKRSDYTAKGAKLREQGQRWIDKIKAAGQQEKPWLDDAERAVRIYTGEGSREYGPSLASLGNVAYDFNILYANVETIVPAVINSPPAPDIRRRFNDTDPVAKEVAELLERAMRIQVDDSRLQTELESTAQDGFLAGRGVVRLRFRADIDGKDDVDLHELAEETVDESGSSDEGDEYETDDSGRDGVGVDGEAIPSGDPELNPEESVSNERITFEAVSWRNYRHGPAGRWEDRPWDAFRHAIPMEDLEAFADSAITDAQVLPEDKLESGETDNDVVVWEVWCKKTRKVHFIEEDTGKQLKIVDDPLGWSGFFPIATPVQPIELTGRLMPVNPFSIYRKLADELDTTTRRIGVITDKMRVKGWYPGSATDLQNMVDALDDDFVPIADAEIWAQNGGLQGAVAFWPAEKYAVVLKQLFDAREQTKQTIYEITGISDIVRGASKATETLGAQEIKSQWGSLRIQKFQRMLERSARDLFVMMSEIIPAKFSPKTLQDMTGIQLIPSEQDQIPVAPPQPTGNPEQDQQAMAQAQQAEQARLQKLQKLASIQALMKQKLQTFYRIDVESDSTVRADLTRQKQEVAEFLQGAGAYWNAVGPLVQQGALPMDVAAEIFASNSRMFNLGKSVEDAIDQMITKAKEASKQPKQPSPEELKAQAEAKEAEARTAIEAQNAQAEGLKAQTEAQTAQVENAERVQALQAKAANDAFELDKKRQTTAVELDGKARLNEQTMRQSALEHAQKMDIGQLQIDKLLAEIGAIGVKTEAQVATAEHNASLAERNQTFKESQADKEPAK
jgi:hypothetical protein